MSIRIPDRVLKYIMSKHRDLTVMLSMRSVDELRQLIKRILESLDEVYSDAYGVKYLLKKIDEHWVNVVVAEDALKTAYIIGVKTYRRLRGGGNSISIRTRYEVDD
ncbi:MAG: hypothetical protein QXE01_06260 [Sulfolobales archaeon]